MKTENSEAKPEIGGDSVPFSPIISPAMLWLYNYHFWLKLSVTYYSKGRNK